MTLTVAIVGGARVAGHPHGTRWDPPERPLRCRPMVWDSTTGWGSRSPYPQPAYPGGILPETGEPITAYPAQGPDIAYGCCLGSTSERLRVLVYANDFANELTWTQPPEEGAPTPHADLLAVAAKQCRRAPAPAVGPSRPARDARRRGPPCRGLRADHRRAHRHGPRVAAHPRAGVGLRRARRHPARAAHP
jgi:hypothetical protein